MNQPTRKPYDYQDRTTPIQPVRLGGTLYHRMVNGQLVRVSPPRPYRGKSQRRQVIRERREAKMSQ